MLSGNGRHRRPRQAPALLVAAGVTGSAIAIPLLGASGASAADGTVWDKVAECETDATWSENTGALLYGGLHISLDEWKKYGGLEFAERPDLASRNQQITVAQKILADQGVGAWPACGLTTGLTKENGAAVVVGAGASGGGTSGSSSDGSSGSGSSGNSDGSGSSGAGSGSGSDSSGDSSGSSGSSGNGSSGDGSASGGSGGTTDPVTTDPASPSPSPTPSGTPSDSPSDKGDSAPSDPSDASTPPSTATGGGRLVQPPDSESTGSSNQGNSDNTPQPSGYSSLVDTSLTGAAAGAPRTLSTDGTGKHRGVSAAETYTVREGDSLVSIADSLGLDGGWRALYAENRNLIGGDPGAIVPGQTLQLGN